MPSHSVHYIIDALLFGHKKARMLQAIHAAKDGPVKLLGPKHRALFHDPATDIMLGLVTRDEQVLASAICHDCLDFGSTALAEHIRRYLLGRAGK